MTTFTPREPKTTRSEPTIRYYIEITDDATKVVEKFRAGRTGDDLDSALEDFAWEKTQPHAGKTVRLIRSTAQRTFTTQEAEVLA